MPPGGTRSPFLRFPLNPGTLAQTADSSGPGAPPSEWLRAIAAAGATILRVAPDNGGISVVNPSKRQPLAYPICTFTYVIVPKQTAKAAELKKFIRWALTAGQRDGPKLLFSPLPKVVLKASLKTLNLVHT